MSEGRTFLSPLLDFFDDLREHRENQIKKEDFGQMMKKIQDLSGSDDTDALTKLMVKFMTPLISYMVGQRLSMSFARAMYTRITGQELYRPT